MPSELDSPRPGDALLGEVGLEKDEEEERLERSLMVLAAQRLASARARLEHLGIVDSEGKVVSSELPPDMRLNGRDPISGR